MSSNIAQIFANLSIFEFMNCYEKNNVDFLWVVCEWGICYFCTLNKSILKTIFCSK